jgi:hypothetical protein
LVTDRDDGRWISAESFHPGNGTIGCRCEEIGIIDRAAVATFPGRNVRGVGNVGCGFLIIC